MPEEASGRGVDPRRLRLVVRAAVGTAIVGVFSTWTESGPVTLNGIEGPNDGWLCMIAAALALVRARLLERGS